jgi:hypothetical protein
MFILLIDVDDDTRSVVFNDLSLHDTLGSHLRGLTSNNSCHSNVENLYDVWVERAFVLTTTIHFNF